MAPCAFDEKAQLNYQPVERNKDVLPGYPRLRLHDVKILFSFLESHLFSPDLERIADKLWWMSMQNNKNISPLHR